MIYVKFGEDKKSVETRTDLPNGELGDYVALPDDSLFGKRLIKTKTKVRELTEKEYAEEATAIDKRQKAIVIDNTARALLAETAYFVEPDFYEDLSEDKKALVKQYRNALRNISTQEKYPEFVEFPNKPTL
jgi:hypothetical protein